MGDDEPILAGKKVLEKELEKLQKEAQWPEENGKAHRGQTKLDQQRIQTSRGGNSKAGGIAREPQSTERNIESGLGPSERGRNDGQKQEPLLVSGRHGGIRRLEQQELAFLRGSASKRLAGWTRTRRFSGRNRRLDVGSPETQQRSRSKEEKIARDDREGIRERCQNGRRLHGWSGCLCRREGCIHGYCKQYSRVNNLRKRKKSGLSNAATDPVSLKVLSCNVAALARDCTYIFLSQISMLPDWDVLLLQECFRKLDGVNVGAHEFFTPSELLGGLRCPAVIVNRKWKGQSKIVGGAARMDCGRAGRTDDFHFSPFVT